MLGTDRCPVVTRTHFSYSTCDLRRCAKLMLDLLERIKRYKSRVGRMQVLVKGAVWMEEGKEEPECEEGEFKMGLLCSVVFNDNGVFMS